MQLRPAAAADQEFLQDLYAQTHGADLAFAGLSANQLSTLLEIQVRAQQQQYFSEYPESVDHVILSDGVAVGRCWLGDAHDELRVLDIAVIPAFQRQGIARAVINELQTKTLTVLRLAVWSQNMPALRLYQQCGFQVPDEIAPGYLELEFRRNVGAGV